MPDVIDPFRLFAALDLVEGAGLGEEADQLREMLRAKIARGPWEGTIAREIRVHDPSGLLDRRPDLRAAIARWISDPAPRLNRLRIRVDPPAPPGLGEWDAMLTFMHDRPEGTTHHQSFLVEDLRQARDPERYCLARLESAHAAIVQSLRESSAPGPVARFIGPGGDHA